MEREDNLSVPSESNTDVPKESIESLPITAQLDWQPLPLIPAAQQDLRCRQCAGAFVDPLASQIPTEPGSTDVQVSADESSSDNDTLSFQGDVSVQQGNRSLRADSVQLDRNQQITKARGNIGYREPGVALLGDSFEYDSGTREAIVIGGTLLGTLIGGSVGRSMDPVDRACALTALEYVPDGQKIRWDGGGAPYELIPRKTFREDGQYCRAYTTTALFPGQPKVFSGTACRRGDGAWEIVY